MTETARSAVASTPVPRSRLTLNAKVWLLAAGLCCATLAVGAIGLVGLASFHRQVDAFVALATDKIGHAIAVEDLFGRLTELERSVILAADDQERDLLIATLGAMEADMRAHRAALTPLLRGDAQRVLDRFDLVWGEWRENHERVLRLTMEHNLFQAARLAASPGRDRAAEGASLLKRIIEEAMREVNQRHRETESAFSRTFGLATALMLAASLAAAVSSQFIARDIARDVARREQAISELKRAEAVKDDFVSMVSHELRTPLTSIMGSLALLDSSVAGALPPKVAAMIDIAHKNCARLRSLIDDILDMDKIRSGKMDFEMRPTRLTDLLERAVRTDGAYAARFGVSLELAPPREDLLVNVDPGRLAQVLSNLLSNAAKFSPPGGTVSVGATRLGATARVSVKDQGPGIPAALKERIFEQFVQIDSSASRERGGTGLGLSIARDIVTAHGGRIDVESEEGRGAEFYFDLPVHGEERRATGQASPARPRRVLVCEDDPDIGVLLTMLLGEMGCETEVCERAGVARDRLLADGFGAMTLDLALPGRDGITLIRELRGLPKTSRLPIVVVSANAARERRKLGGDTLGVVDWLDKPIDPRQFRVAVERALTAGREPWGDETSEAGKDSPASPTDRSTVAADPGSANASAPRGGAMANTTQL